MTKFASSFTAAILFLSTCMTCYADVQYTENTKITGGAAAGAMKLAGVFSKEARQATKGTELTISVKHNKMRHEDSNGQVSIYDLEARKIMHLDMKHKTYSVMTFEEMRAQVEEAQRKAAAERAKKGKDQGQLKITPKISITPGKGNKTLLNHTATEVKTRIDMKMEGQDDKGRTQSGDYWVNSDAYVAQVKAYEEVKRFYMRMAKELDWVPGAVFGNNSNVQIQQPMIEYRKSLNDLSGMPLQTFVSIGMGAAGGTEPARDEAKSSSGNPLAKGLGGVFKKKKHEDEEPAPAGTPGSLVDMQTDVTSISTDTLDASLFQVPAGFKLETKEHSSK